MKSHTFTNFSPSKLNCTATIFRCSISQLTTCGKLRRLFDRTALLGDGKPTQWRVVHLVFPTGNLRERFGKLA